MAQIGEVTTAYIVKARWAFAELCSPRFGKFYAGSGPQHLFDAAAAGAPFSSLTPADHDQLVQMLDVGRNPQFASNVASSPLYYCASLTRGQVAQLWALPLFGPPPNHPAIPFMDFFLDTYGSGNTAAESDPRLSPSSTALTADHEPVIVIRASQRHFLLEGYGRAIAFMRANDRNDRLRAWCPLATTINE